MWTMHQPGALVLSMKKNWNNWLPYPQMHKPICISSLSLNDFCWRSEFQTMTRRSLTRELWELRAVLFAIRSVLHGDNSAGWSSLIQVSLLLCILFMTEWMTWCACCALVIVLGANVYEEHFCRLIASRTRQLWLFIRITWAKSLGWFFSGKIFIQPAAVSVFQSSLNCPCSLNFIVCCWAIRRENVLSSIFCLQRGWGWACICTSGSCDPRSYASSSRTMLTYNQANR